MDGPAGNTDSNRLSHERRSEGHLWLQKMVGGPPNGPSHNNNAGGREKNRARKRREKKGHFCFCARLFQFFLPTYHVSHNLSKKPCVHYLLVFLFPSPCDNERSTQDVATAHHHENTGASSTSPRKKKKGQGSNYTQSSARYFPRQTIRNRVLHSNKTTRYTSYSPLLNRHVLHPTHTHTSFPPQPPYSDSLKRHIFTMSDNASLLFIAAAREKKHTKRQGRNTRKFTVTHKSYENSSSLFCFFPSRIRNRGGGSTS